MRLYLLTFLGFVFFATLAEAQGEATFSIEVSTTTAMTGEPFEVKFVVENAQNGRFVPPSWDLAGFSVLNTSQSSNFSFSNGTSNSVSIYKYQIIARDTGLLEIPAATLQTGKEALHTTSKRIHIIPGNGNYSDREPLKDVRPSAPAQDPRKKIKTIRL